MKSQWMLILGFVFALIVAVFAVVNVGSVEFNYLFGKTTTPLILIILFSTLFGGLTVGFLGMFRIYILSKRLKQYEKEWEAKGLEPLPTATTLFSKQSKAKEGSSTATVATKYDDVSSDSSDGGSD